jgi:uncharacterized protein YcbK (DUF882 family)
LLSFAAYFQFMPQNANHSMNLDQQARRAALKTMGIVLATGGLLCAGTKPASAWFQLGPDKNLKRTSLVSREALQELTLYSPNTREAIRTIFKAEGAYVPENLFLINQFCRDYHQNVAHTMDPKLIQLLYALQRDFDNQQIHVISGYRTPQTNAALARTTVGVGKDSYHMKGMAIDIRIPDVPVAKLRDAAKRYEVGGVGYYPAQNFIHIDTGPVRYWA